ncbi:pyoverdine biosynthesis protein PvdE [Streptomyces sp. NBRC 110611]|uniref:cyclic peptide export ABC transporter n=1 Tax=Streptomyces sp. NBRC 110611 TaxID=1621259 RepID=UPI000835E24C|nr:cyclic peptide export ABC transporter [Streptomyces sp. NBRC 110611]GAU68941.1 pyoverdine biosynthesis protein PvdE [Streptomyces sp. NBRC 110611]
MGLFGYLLRSSRRPFLLALAASVISGAAGAAFIAMVNTALSRTGDVPAAVVWAFTGLCVATVVTRFLSQNLLFRLSQGFIQRLRRRLVDGILDAPLRSVEKLGTARLYSALADDVVVIADALPGLPMVCFSGTFAVVCVIYLAVVSPAVALTSLLAMGVAVGVYRMFSAYGMRHLGAAREEQDRLFEHFRAVTEGTKELKLDRRRREALAGAALDATATTYRRRSVVGLSVFEGAAGSGQTVFFGLIGVLLFVFPVAFAVSAKTLTDSVMVLLFMVSSLQGVLTWLPVLGRAAVALRKIEERLADLEGAGREQHHDSPAAPDGNWQRIHFRGVAHAYPGATGEQFVLGPLDFTFRRGEVLFVVGGNGSGKTTLAKLLTGLYLPEQGAVWVDDNEVTDDNRDAYRELFGAVFSDFFLFESLGGLPDADRAAKAGHYLRRLQLDHKVSIVDDRFSTTELSTGQRKRLALLTAYLADRPCYLFDEWAADQDPVFKEFFYTELLAELKAKGRTVVVISHDDQYFPVADRIVRLDYGRIREDQDHAGRAGRDPARESRILEKENSRGQ